VQAIIDRDDDVWDTIAGELGVMLCECKVKRDVFKRTGCRLLCDGRIGFTNAFLWEHDVDAIVQDSPTLMAIIHAVRRVKSEVRANGGTMTPLGWIELPSRKDKPVRAHLAYVLQAYELALILPCFDVVERSQDFTITICQHDGFSIKLRWEDRASNVLDRLNDAIAPVAKLYDINTRLEYKT
jgi:hypothetical protein